MCRLFLYEEGESYAFKSLPTRVGPSLADASPGKMPDVALLEGRYCSVEHLTVAEHYEDILDFYFTNQILSDWTYMYADPFESEEAVRQCLEDYEQSQNPYFFAIRDKASGKVLGTFSLMAITPKNRSVEMGRVILAPALQRLEQPQKLNTCL